MLLLLLGFLSRSPSGHGLAMLLLCALDMLVLCACFAFHVLLIRSVALLRCSCYNAFRVLLIRSVMLSIYSCSTLDVLCFVLT